MARKSALILEPDKDTQQQLIDVLSGSGFDVYGIGSPAGLIDALKKTPFPLLIADLPPELVDAATIVRTIKQASPFTVVLVSGVERDFKWLLQVFRAGAADFLTKPLSAAEIKERVQAAWLGRKKLRTDSASSFPLPKLPQRGAGEVDRELLTALQGFQDQALEVFLDMERRTIDLEMQLEVAAGHSRRDNRPNRTLTLLVAHADPELTQVLTPTLSELGCELYPQVYTGGEVLEQVGQQPIDIVLVNSDLPDIPGSIVASSVKAQSADITVLLLDGWGTAEATLQRVEEGGETSAPHQIGTASNIAALVRDQVAHHRDHVEARKFAQRFKSRNQRFLRSMADVRSRLVKALQGE